MKEKGNGFSFKPTEGNKKANSVTTKCGSRMDDDFICVAMRGCNPNNPSDRTSGSQTEQRLEPNLNGKTNTITTVQKDNLILLGNLSGGKWDKTHESNRRVYSENGKMQTIQTMQGGNQHPKTMQYDRIRRLTPTILS